MVGRSPERGQDQEEEEEEAIDPDTGKPVHESIIPTIIRGATDDGSYDPDDLLSTHVPVKRSKLKRLVIGRPDPNDPDWSKKFIDSLLGPEE